MVLLVSYVRDELVICCLTEWERERERERAHLTWDCASHVICGEILVSSLVSNDLSDNKLEVQRCSY